MRSKERELMEKTTVDEMLEHIEREISLLRTENHLGGYDYESFRHKKECDRLTNLYNEIAYFRTAYC